MLREERQMSEEMIVRQCSPTMAGLKTGNLFASPDEDSRALNKSISGYNKRLVPKGIRMVPLGKTGRRTLIYMYRPEKLRADLSDETARKILSERGYPIGNTEECVCMLAQKIRNSDEFPHEIGLFLGYPSEDVDGFIRNKAGCAKCVGTWKVYGDADAAKKKFAGFEKCTRVYCDCYRRNIPFDRLAVCCTK